MTAMRSSANARHEPELVSDRLRADVGTLKGETQHEN